MPDGSPPRPSQKRDLHGAAFRQLYRDHYAFVWRYVRSLGLDESAEDAVQEVFVTAYRRRNAYVGQGTIRAWLAGIARKVVFRLRRSDQRRHRRHDALARDAAVVAPVSESPDDWLRRKEAAAFLDDFLSGLDLHKRSAFILYELEGLKGREVAAALDVNPNTAHARLRAARALFAQACAEAQGTGRPIDAAELGELYRDEQPPSRSVKRGWAAFVAQTGWTAGGAAGSATAASTGLAAWAGQLKVAALTIAIGGSAVVVVDQVAASSPATTAAPTTHATRAEATHRSPIAVAATAAPSARTPSPVADTRRASPPRDEPRPPAEPAARSTPAEESPGELSRREYELLREAQRAQRKGQWPRALASTQQLLTQHPDSRLTPDATLVQVKALCRLQRRKEAAEAAEALEPGTRRSILAKYCD